MAVRSASARTPRRPRGGPIDLRSDTVTLPPPAMRQAMAAAELGDDVYGEDPTVARLERRAAELLGTETALFVASGTMANLLAILCLAGRGRGVLAEARSHVALDEPGMVRLAGVRLVPVATSAGVLAPADLDTGGDLALAVVESTHNRHGGLAWPPAALAALRAAAAARRIRVHLDGARLFNAAVALGVDPREIAQHADTISFCVSKGLAAPVGSLLCGPRPLIEEARRQRRCLGGGWRQAGVLAAAGLYGLDHLVERLAEDHANARALAEGLAGQPGMVLDLDRVQTNIVLFRLAAMAPAAFLAGCRARGLLGSSLDGGVRLVTHLGVGRAEVSRALEVCEQVLGGVDS